MDPFGNWAARVTAQEFHVGERWRSAKLLAPHNPMTPANQPGKRGPDGCQFVGACAALGEDVQQLAAAILVADQVSGHVRARSSSRTWRHWCLRSIQNVHRH